MKVTRITDKSRLAAYLKRYAHLNYYHLGDLDDFYWPRTTWFCAEEGEEIRAIVLIYNSSDGPYLLAINNDNDSEMGWLAKQIMAHLPNQIYALLSPGLEQILAERYTLEDHGPHYKMVLVDPKSTLKMDASDVVSISTNQVDDVLALFARSYPGNWFDPVLLETGQYFGWRDETGVLRSVAGVHSFSPEFGVAAVGNITTDPEFRSRGLGTRTTARLCQSLLESVSTIGLNVKQDNPAAIRSYQKLGFEVMGEYGEFMLILRKQFFTDQLTKTRTTFQSLHRLYY